MQYLIGIDVGTSAAKIGLFEQNGETVLQVMGDYPMNQPANGWAEQDPEDWWRAVCSSLRMLVIKSGVEIQQIRGIGLTGQMHGLVMLDEENRVIRPAILWCDQRTAGQCREITQRLGQGGVIRLTANPALPAFTASKLLWVREHEPENYRRCRHILLPKDYIRFRLTGAYATDYSDASGMQLLDVIHRRWSEEMLQMLEIRPELLPRLCESDAVSGCLNRDAAAQTGLPERLPVAGGAGDNEAAAVGTGVVRNGAAFTTIGTSGVVYVHTDRPVLDPKGRVHTFCSAVRNSWHVMGVTQSAGLSLKWFRDNFCGEEVERAKALHQHVYKLTDQMAATSPIGARRLIFLPYLMGERTPHLDPDCRGVFFGISAIHRKADFLRAIMEGVTYSLADCLTVFREMGVPIDRMAVCGGGANSELWQQMIADVFGQTICTVEPKEGAALGAAILAGVATKVYPNVRAGCDATIRVASRRDPISGHSERYQPYYEVYRALYQKLRPFYAQLAEIPS